MVFWHHPFRMPYANQNVLDQSSLLLSLQGNGWKHWGGWAGGTKEPGKVVTFQISKGLSGIVYDFKYKKEIPYMGTRKMQSSN